MITLEEYLKDPCGSLALTYSKAKKTALRRDMLIVNDTDYDAVLYRDFFDRVFIKAKNDLLSLNIQPLNDHYFIKNVFEKDFDDIVELVNQSYTNKTIDKEELNKMWYDDLCHKDFWCAVYSKRDFILNKETKEKIYKPIGIFIGNLDDQIGEASIEIFCIKPEFRRKGIGFALLKEALLRIGCDSTYVTVMYPEENEFNLKELFDKVGFNDGVRWHLLKKKPQNELAN